MCHLLRYILKSFPRSASEIREEFYALSVNLLFACCLCRSLCSSVEQFSAGILADCQQLSIVKCSAAVTRYCPVVEEQFGDPADLDKLPTILKAAYALLKKCDARFFSVSGRNFGGLVSRGYRPRQGWKTSNIDCYELTFPFLRKKPAP